MKREANFQTTFRHWLKANKRKFPSSAAFELKQTTKEYLSFDTIAEHQDIGMQAAKSEEGILYKAPDDSMGVKPFDFFWLVNADAYIVIKFPKCFCIIEHAAFIEEKIRSERKSLTQERALWISHVVVDL